MNAAAAKTACKAQQPHLHGCCCRSHPHSHSRPVRCQASALEAAQIADQVLQLSQPDVAAAVSALPVLADLQAGATAVAAASDVQSAVSTYTYTPGPIEVGWQIWFAAFVSTVPFVIGAYEFGKRIVIQRRCKVCGGSGLVQRGRFQRKCPECGGFFPWVSWSMFLSANARPGDGGPLLQPRGQTSVFYTVPPADSQQQQDEPEHQGNTPPGTNSTVEDAEPSTQQPAAAHEGTVKAKQ